MSGADRRLRATSPAGALCGSAHGRRLGLRACGAAPAPDEPDARRLALLRFGGYVLSGLAFALDFSQPPTSSAVFSANTLAVSILGLALYASSLTIERHPAFLYMAIGAIVAGRVGAQYFLAERLHAIEEAVRRLLRYPEFLPVPFRAILFLIPSLALGYLAIWFVKHWNDRRLARHCHYIGLPLSVAALAWSGFEPLAGLICWSGYAVLYLLAVWIFAAPPVSYLAVAAITGAVYFGSRQFRGITGADQALLAAMLGIAFWVVRWALRKLSVRAAYRLPWLRGRWR